MILWKASWKIGFWRKCDGNFMNEPVEYNWTENDVIEEFEKYKDKKMIAKIYDITVKEVTEILKRIKD